MKNTELIFRRQFLLTPKVCESLHKWKYKSFGSFHIYAHPDIELNISKSNKSGLKFALIGYMIDPNYPDRSNMDILNDMLNSISTTDNISEYLYNIAGRFVLVINSSTETLIFHDPCGLRTVYYTKYEGETYVASQPLIFEHVLPLKRGDVYHTYEESEYKKNYIEHWIPSGYSLYNDIYHLVPNHYLQFSTHAQKRYWPKEKIQKIQLDDAVSEASELLRNLMMAADNRFKLALPLTAGWDSRIILSASKNIAPDMFFYTLQYRNLQSQSNDIRIPKELLYSIGYKHNIIDCRKKTNLEFSNIYEKNVSMVHQDWKEIAYGMLGSYPSDRVCIKGNAAEIGRLSGLSSRGIKSVDDIVDYIVPGWNTIPYIKKQLSPWYIKSRTVASECEIDLNNLFYWEHRMGSWQAQSQLEWDIIQETFTPFNHRALLEITLGVSPKFRSAPNYILYQEIGENLWPEVMEYPINPPENMKERLKEILSYFGLLEISRKIYEKFFHNRFQIR